jgi:hypothetical protein
MFHLTSSSNGRAFRVAALLGVAIWFAGAVRAETGDATALAGSWQSHTYTFNFMGFTTTYSCDGLEDKLRRLLMMSGAGPNRHDVKVSAPCVRGVGRPDKLAMADLTFSSLQPVPSAVGAPVGVWRHVALAPHQPFEFESGDCELIEEFRDKVLPMFTTRNLVDKISCVPHQDSGSNFSLSFDVFAPPVPIKKS